MADQIRVRPDDPEAMRAEIESTRARMSATIDEIEDVLVEKKERIREQLDVGARIRAKPLQAAGAVFGAGLLLGLLTGGRGGGRKEVKAAARRAALWEERARRLLEITRTQEAEIDTLTEEASQRPRVAPPPRREAEQIEELRDRLAELREVTADRLARAARSTRKRFRKRLRG